MNKCPYCPRPVSRLSNNAKTCGNIKCQRAQKHDWWVKNRTNLLPSTVVICDNCGNKCARRRPSKTGKVFCSRQECRRAGSREYKLYRKAHPGDYVGVMGISPVHPILYRLVEGKGAECATCLFVPNCRKRTQVGLPVACEKITQRDIDLLEMSEDRDMRIALLQEGLVIQSSQEGLVV